MSNPLKLVIFDVDGTLVDSQEHILASMQYAFQRAGRPEPSRRDALGIVGLSLPEAMRVLVPDAGADEIAQLTVDYKSGHTQHREDGSAVAKGPMFDGALGAIHLLNDTGYLFSAATGKTRVALQLILVVKGVPHLVYAPQTGTERATTALPPVGT